MKHFFENVLVRTSGSLAALALVLMALLVTGDVLMRLFGFALVGSVEVSSILLAVLVFAGVAFTQATDGHVTMEAFVNLMPPLYRRCARIVSLILCSLTCALLAWGSALEAYNSYVEAEFQFGTVHFPLWPTKCVVAIGIGLLAIELSLQAAEAIRSWHDGDTSGEH